MSSDPNIPNGPLRGGQSTRADKVCHPLMSKRRRLDRPDLSLNFFDY